MPYSDIGQAFADIGRTVASTLAEKRKKDREKEERMRLAEMLRRFGASPSAVEGVASGLDPGTMMSLDDDVERREKLKDKERAEAQARDAAGQEFQQVLANTRGQGPTSPLEATQQRVYQDMEPAGQLNTQQEMLKMFAERNEKDQLNQIRQKYTKDPNLPMSASDILAMTNNDIVKAGKYQGKPLSAMAAEDKDPATKKWENDIAVRRKAQELRKTDPVAADNLLEIHGLKDTSGGNLPSVETQQGQVQSFYTMLKNLDNQRVSQAGSTLDASGKIVSVSPTPDSTLMQQAVGLSQQMTGAKQSVTKDYSSESVAVDDRMRLIEEAIKELDEELKR